MRNLSSGESAIIERLLQAEFDGRDVISRQVSNALVDQIDPNGSLKFQVLTEERAASNYRVPVEAACEDVDGTTVHILLHLLDGRVEELEIFKDDLSQVTEMPDPKTFRLFAPPFKWS